MGGNLVMELKMQIIEKKLVNVIMAIFSCAGMSNRLSV
jgi:hypothetical protein